MEKLPKLAIVGYGAMGREIETLALAQGFEITDIFDIEKKINPEKDYEFDVAIEFTEPNVAFENIDILTKMRKNVVVGTTGWLDKLDYVKNNVERIGTGLVYGTNFSIGMQMFFRIVRNAAQLINKTSDYDIMLHELHHHRKKDSPSGSAKTIANIIIDEVETKNAILEDTARTKISPKMLHLSSTRGGEIFGRHTVYIDSIADTIELTHNAKSRHGFATGAITAAKWIKGKHGVYDFSTILDELWK